MSKGKGKGKGKPKANKRSSLHYSPIDKHQRQGKTLIPPLLQVPNLRTQSWLNDRLPDMLWAALILTHMNRGDALSIFRQVAQSFTGIDASVQLDATLSAIAGLPQGSRDQILGVLSKTAQLRTILRPLLLLHDLPGLTIWRDALHTDPVPSDWGMLAAAVGRTADHQSQEATDCRWVRLLCMVFGGKFDLPQHIATQFINYPNEGDMATVRPFIRASEIAIGAALQHQNGSATGWPELFWTQCWNDTKCIVGFQLPVNSAGVHTTSTEQVRQVRKALGKHFMATSRTTHIDPAHEATFGIAVYCLFVLDELLRSGNSRGVLGRLGLRTLLESYVTLSYLVVKNETEIWQAFRSYGQGQAKLTFLKLDDEEIPTPSCVNLDTLEFLANEDQWLEFTKVDLGHWDKTDLRSMSEKAGVKSEYDRFYSWTSGFVHGSWPALRTASFDVCTNPLHRFHRVPKLASSSLDDVVSDACYLADKVLDLVDKTYPSFTPRTTA